MHAQVRSSNESACLVSLPYHHEYDPVRGGATGCSRWSQDHPKFWPNPVAQSRRAVPGARQASSTRCAAGRLLQQASGDTRWAIDVRHAADRLQRQASGVRRATAAGAASRQGQAAAIRPSRQAARQQRAAGERCGSGRVRGGVTLLLEVRGTDNPRSSRGLHLQSNQSKYYQFEGRKGCG
ncbi:uncharacterized protein LOC133923476 [Phragmites australis]|uniref:uncharacterized protein LOC133923476 n=1 Tax=Phragmites australis TaxID=29695 RepID=UPI002D79192B|nr:uncharacterized protein LOC133923476 [Phragmites australis]